MPVLCILGCGLLVMFFFEDWSLNWIYADSAVYRYVGKTILAGGMPYRDTFDHKGPFLYLIQVAGLSFGTHGIWFLEFTALLVSFAYFYKTARLLGCGRCVSCVGVCCGAFYLLSLYDGGNMNENFALPFLSVSLHIFLTYFLKRTNITRWHLIVCGCSFAVVALLKVNMAGLWVAMCLGVIADCIREMKIRQLFGYIFWFLSGLCAIFVPVLLWLCVNHAFGDFIQDYFSFNFFYSSTSTQWASLGQKFRVIYESLFFFPVIFSALCLFFLSVSKKRFLDILCLSSIAFNLVLISIAGRASLHYRAVLTPLIVYALSSLFMECDAWKVKRIAPLIIALTFCMFSAKGVVTALRMRNTESMQIAQIVRENSDETDRITVCGNDDSIYLFSNRWSVSKYSYQSPPCFLGDYGRSMEMREEYFQDVETLKPKIVVLPSAFPAYERMKAVAERGYRLLETVGETEIYLLKET